MVSGAHNTGVSWSLSPAVGTMNNGYYVAPSVITTPQIVTLKATSLEDPSKSGSAILSLMPNGGMTVSAVALLSVVPSFAVLQSNDSITFRAQLNGANSAAVVWSIAPPVGSISGGVYTAPNAIQNPQTVVVTATSMANSTQTGNATISLLPKGSQGSGAAAPVTVTVNPSSVSLTAGQTARFSAVVSGTRNTGVTWSLSPSVGTMSNGFYMAPGTLNSSQTVMLTAISMADPTRTASVPIFLMADTSAGVPAGSGGVPAGSGGAPAVPVSIQLSPTSASLKSGQSSQFSATVSGSQNSAVTWSVVPQVGSVVNGLYTAPTVTAQTNLTLVATSVSDPTKTASAAITVQPATVSISLSPSSVWLTHGQSTQFSAAVNGTSNTGVTWTLTPAVGSITNGLYTAPASVTSQRTITVTATSMADPSKAASATVTLAPVSITMVPTSISLGASASSQFTATVTGTLNTGVTWSMAPGFGSMVNGLYTAPATIGSAQTVTLTATSLADPTQTAHATISLTPNVTTTLSVAPTPVSLSASQTQQFSALVSSGGIGGGAPVSAQWTINPPMGSITQTGLYTAPGSISVQQLVTVTATSSAGNASASLTLTPTATTPPTTPPTTTAVQLPLEVMGPAGTTVGASFTLPPGSNLNGLQLWLQIHGLKYETEASVQVNGGAWIPINSSTGTVLGQAKVFGGIGGGFSTLKMTLNLPAGSLVTGQNNLTFRFEGTDGVTSGYRVLNFNILSLGSQLIPQSSFTWDDPSRWQPPLNNAADIQAGQTLWRTATLTAPGFGQIQAKCSSCHAQDGRDLKYFNYSNYSIRVRAMFHGLTAQQGDQIASYIRSLNAPAPASARPWNPPYQPGPGADSRPVSEWASGAGVDAVVDDDQQMLSYLMPGGSTAAWEHNAYLNAREMPIPLQLADWNQWLPKIHPMDSFGAAFSNSTLMALYQKLRSELRPNDSAAYAAAASDFGYWESRDLDFTTPITPASTDPSWQSPNFTNAIYSIRLWSLVKQWELNQEFGLEGMPQAVFGAQSSSRAWYSQMPFVTFNVPHDARGIGNGLPITSTYDRYRWYHLQLVLNDGNGTAQGTWPIDWGYALGFPSNDLTWDNQTSQSRFADASLLILWLVKGLQAKDRQDPSNGWSLVETDPADLVNFPAIASIWNESSTSTKLQMINSYLGVWLRKVQTFTPQQWYASGNANPIFLLDQSGSLYSSRIAHALPRFRFVGVDSTLLNQLTSLAQTNWPAYNWSAALNAPCSLSAIGEILCTIP